MCVSRPFGYDNEDVCRVDEEADRTMEKMCSCRKKGLRNRDKNDIIEKKKVCKALKI